MIIDLFATIASLVSSSRNSQGHGSSVLRVTLSRGIGMSLLALSFFLLSVSPAHAAPKITLMTPATGPVGTVVAISGSGFGTTQGSSTVTFNGTPVTWVSWSSTSLEVQVPAGATSGKVVVSVSGTASNSETFTVTSAPVIASLSQYSGAVGSSLTVSGSGFSANGTQTPQVVFNPSLYANPTSSTDASITVTVPPGATTGDLFVSVGGGSSNAALFTVTSSDPSIGNISPGSGTVGTSVTITGSNFSCGVRRQPVWLLLAMTAPIPAFWSEFHKADQRLPRARRWLESSDTTILMLLLSPELR